MLLKLPLDDSSEAQLTYVGYSDHHVPLRQPEVRCRPWPNGLHRRRRWQNAFSQWYSANEERFVIKLELLKRTDAYLGVGFCGVSRVITASITCDEIAIAVEWHGLLWDILQDFETYPQRVSNGYVCEQCPEDSRPVFASREALWRAEVFEPFLEWVNRDLANAVALSISGTLDDASWARFVPGTQG